MLQILIGTVMVLGFLFYLYIQVDKVHRLFKKDEYTEIFNVDNLPSVQEQALRELQEEGVL